MNGLVRRASVAAAKTTTRRGFLARSVRGLIGAGLGLGFLLGAQNFAYACFGCNDSSCGTSGLCGQNCPGCGAGGACPALYTATGQCRCSCGSAEYYCCTICAAGGSDQCVCPAGRC